MRGIFGDNAHRLYHWVENRAVPADNNRAERELRPTVIARKVSFGSQSDAGAKTREALMSEVHTLAKRVADREVHFNLLTAVTPRPAPPAAMFARSPRVSRVHPLGDVRRRCAAQSIRALCDATAIPTAVFRFKAVLDQLAVDPTQDPAALLLDTS